MNLEYLDLVIEEAAEVIHAACKIKRFGLNDSHPTYYDGLPNGHVLTTEIGQLLHVIDKLDLNPYEVEFAKQQKAKKLETFGPHGTYIAGKR